MHKLRKIFNSHVEKESSKKKVALLLSSGMDSLVVGLTAHDLGKKVTAFTFRPEGIETFDSKHARVVAEKMGWDFNIVEVPVDAKSIKRFWLTDARKLKCVKKRDYECAYPMLYCYQTIRKSGFTEVLSGLVADGHFLFNRNTHIAKISGPNSVFEKYVQFRTEYFEQWLKSGYDSLGRDYNPSGLLQHHLICTELKLKHINPFLDKRTFDFFIKRSWLELNKPKQKQDLINGWEDHIAVVGSRNHRGYQTEAKIPMYFAKLLADKEINFKGRSNMIHVAKDWDNRNKNPVTNSKPLF